MLKKIVLIFAVVAAIFIQPGLVFAGQNYKQAVDNFLKELGAKSNIASNYEIREVLDTASPGWKAVVVYFKQGRAKQPVIFLISKDRKSIVPNSMVYVDNKPVFNKRFQPEFEKIDFKLTEKDRIVYNPSGTKTVFMFSDPDCPYCKQVDEKLKDYNGEYRVVRKHFPLEQIHPDAKRKAVEMQEDWLRKVKKDDLPSEEALKEEAKRIVDEDIAEAARAEVPGTPFFILEDGSVLMSLF